MVSRLPQWVEYGAFTLAAVAGSINAVGLLGFQHQAVSHLSGTATLLGAALPGPPLATLHLLGILLAFLSGAALTGLLIKSASVKVGRHYDTLLYLEGLLLLVALLLLRQESLFGHYVASAACGLQNALATRYSDAIVRTTHVTGIFTDLGLMLGAKLRGETFDRRKATLLLLIVAGFIFGGSAGSLLFRRWEFQALLAPAAACFLLATIYRGYRQRITHAAADSSR